MKSFRKWTIFALFLLVLAAMFSCAKKEKAEEYVYPTETYDTPPDTVIDGFDGKNTGIILDGNTLYYASDAGLFCFDEETNTGVPVLEKPVDFVEKYHGAIYAVSLAERTLYRIENGAAEAVVTGLDERITPENAFGFAICDTWFVFLGRDPDNTAQPLALYKIDRKTGETTAAPVASSISKVFSYEGNRLFLYNDGWQSDNYYFALYNAETELEDDRIPISQTGVSDAEYCPYNDSLLMVVRDSITQRMTLKQLSLEDRVTRTLTAFDDASKPNVKGLIATETNIVCCGRDNSGTFRYFNLDEEHRSVTVAVYGFPQGTLQVMMNLFKDRRDIDVNVIQIEYGQVEKLNTRLLAREDDFDLYYTFGLTPAYYILRNAYCDLGQFDVLQDNLSRCAPLLEASASYNGEIIGVPTEFGLVDSADENNPYNNSFYQYMAREIDLTKKEFRDENGEALKTLYEHYRTYPDDNGPEPPWGDFRMVWCEYMIMNPASRHKEEAALFLNDLLSLQLGDYDGEAASYPLMQLVTKYPEIADFNDVSVRWKFTDMNVFNMIRDGFDALKPGDMTDGDAKELASKIRMAVME